MLALVPFGDHRFPGLSQGGPGVWLVEIIPPGQQAGLSARLPPPPSYSILVPEGLAGLRVVSVLRGEGGALVVRGPLVHALCLALTVHSFCVIIPALLTTFTGEQWHSPGGVSWSTVGPLPGDWSEMRGPRWAGKRPGLQSRRCGWCKVFSKPLLFRERDGAPPPSTLLGASDG